MIVRSNGQDSGRRRINLADCHNVIVALIAGKVVGIPFPRVERDEFQAWSGFDSVPATQYRMSRASDLSGVWISVRMRNDGCVIWISPAAAPPR